jgi:hypothetical protein
MIPIPKTTIIVLALSVALSASASAARAGDNSSSPVSAQPAPDQDDGFLKNMMKKAGVATDVGEPQDFVVKSRPTAPADYVPVFRKTEEHKTKLLTPDQVKGMEADLDGVSQHNAKIRDAFPPARRAYLETEREKAAKAAGKRNATPTSQ